MIELKLKTESVPVRLTSEDGSVIEYELREMTASDRDKYLTSLGSRVRLDKEGKPAGIKSFDGMQADLIQRCLFTPDGKQVKADEIQKWPASVVTQIFEAAQKLNQLDREENQENEAKND